MNKLKRVYCFCLLLVITGSSYSQQDSLAKVFTNSINFNPLGIALGSIGANYEHLFGTSHGLMIQGGFQAGYGLSTGSGYALAMQYRYHYFKNDKQNGLNSPFWGPFIYYEAGQSEVKDNNAGTTYDLDVKYLKAGANWGRRWIWKNSFNLVFRAGYGFPLMAEYTWSPTEPEEVEAIESLTSILAGIDAEFTMGIAF